MIKKFSEAIALLEKHLLLFAALVLTIWLPGNLIINLISYNTNPDAAVMITRMTMWIEALVGPIYIAAMIHALQRIKSGHSVTYKEAMGVGLKKWGPLFGARFVAGLLVLLGTIALIVPGIILMVRYALLDTAVVLENKGVAESRVRSTALTAGKRWEILGAGLLFGVAVTALSFTLYFPLGLFDFLDNIVVSTAIDCVLDVVYLVIQIVLFLYYWEAVQAEKAADMSRGAGEEAVLLGSGDFEIVA